jgi:hypothetical protein
MRTLRASDKASLPQIAFFNAGFGHLLVVGGTQRLSWWFNRPATVKSGRLLLVAVGVIWIVVGFVNAVRFGSIL